MTAAYSPDANSQPPKLLDQVRVLGIEAGHSVQAVRSFVDWNRRFILSVTPDEVKAAVEVRQAVRPTDGVMCHQIDDNRGSIFRVAKRIPESSAASGVIILITPVAIA